MLREEPNSAPASPRPAGRPARGTYPFLAAVVLVVLILRHDYWWWDRPGHLLFGFLPAGLWWQGLVSLLAAGMMWLMVRFAWPYHIEADAEEAERRRAAGSPAKSQPGKLP